METKNEPCLVIQFNPAGNEIVGIELTTTFNYLEKEAFVDMNRKQLFPCKANGIKFKDFDMWFINILMSPLSDKVNKIIKTIKDTLPTVFYPGYD